MTISNREQWLTRAVKELTPMYRAVGHDVPALRVSVGWPGGGSKRTRIGECWHPSNATDGIGQVFISPILASPGQVLETLAHEVIHVINHAEGHGGHRKEFGAIARGIGLQEPMTATTAGPELEAKLAKIAAKLGPYPHAALTPGKGKVQSTRMLKVICPRCINEQGSPYTVRMTRSWLDTLGAPICPGCHGTTVEA